MESFGSQGLEVRFSNDITEAPQAVQLALYRIVQEALTNVVRHADARSASVRLTQSPSGYTVTVVDDGVGPRAEATSGVPSGTHEGRGLLGMRERAELLGGRLSAGASAPAGTGGFTVEATFPR